MAKKKLALALPAWIQRNHKIGQRTEDTRNITRTTAYLEGEERGWRKIV